jgi:hypothetical protein
MLVHEPDGTRCFDGARIGTQRSESDARKRRFSGAVLADERMNFARKKIEVDAVNGDDPWKFFPDTVQRERRCGRDYTLTGFQRARSSRVDGTVIFPLTMAA